MTKWLTDLAVQYKNKILLLVLVQICLAAVITMVPAFFQKIVSLALSNVTAFFLPEGIKVLGFLTAIFLLAALLQGICGYIACIFSADLLKQLQLDFFEKTSCLPLLYFQHRSAGEFMTKFNHDIGQIQGLLAASLPLVLREAVTIICILLIVFFLCSGFLMVLAFGMVIIVSFLVMKLNQRLKPYAQRQRAGWGKINKIFDETIQGIDTIKTFSSEEQVKKYFTAQTVLLRKISVKAGTITALFSPLIDLIAKIGGLFLILIAYYLIIRESLLSEQFLLFFFYAGLLQASVSSLIQGLSNIQPQLVSAANLFAFFSEKPETTTDATGTALLEKPCSIQINNLCFRYPEKHFLFQGAKFTIPKNKITLIQGPSGSGKSTLINLLLGFYSPAEGEILFGKIPVSRFSKKELRGKIGVLTQYHYIFHDTLKKNLEIASPGAPDADIVKALEKAHLCEFLHRLPKGIHTVMDPRGKGISGGEKQRICMARILLKNPPVIILDEPWSNLDARGRDILISVINRCRQTATILVLSHETPASLEIDQIYQIMPVIKTCENC